MSVSDDIDSVWIMIKCEHKLTSRVWNTNGFTFVIHTTDGGDAKI